jgi:Protein of unknown function (DUF3987)
LDRKGNSEALFIPRPFISIAGGIQPDVLPEIKSNCDDGFLDRFLFSYPDTTVDWYSEAEISEEAESAYKNIYGRLHALRMLTDDKGVPAPQYLGLTTRGKELFEDAYNSLVRAMNQPEFPNHLKGYWSKLRSITARLALIIGLANQADNAYSGSGNLGHVLEEATAVGEKDVEAAIALVEYFKAHARRTYARLHGEKPDTLLAETLKDFLNEHGGYWEGTTSDLYDLMKGRSAPGLPGDVGPFGKRIRYIASQDYDLDLGEGHQGKDHLIKLSLSTFGTVGDAGASTDTEGTESKIEKGQAEPGVSDRLPEIIEAIDQLFIQSPDHGVASEPDLIANELYLFKYLDFYPEDEEVEQALKLRG